MKKMHDFDEVFDSQKVFRIILDTLSNPGKVSSIEDSMSKIPEENSCFLAVAMTLLDNEVSFNTCGNEELAKKISLLTLSKEEGLAKADFIFVEGIGTLEKVMENAKCGTLENPHKSATVIVKVTESFNETIEIYGAGVDGVMHSEVPMEVKVALELRKKENYEYPQGIDFIFVTDDGRILAVPRLVMQEVG